MEKPKEKNEKNFLDIIPRKNEKIRWRKEDKDGKTEVTLEIDNVGIINKIAQKLLKKPKVNYIHLDEMGSFIWQYIDSKKTVYEIAEYVSEHFKEKANPLYERLIKYLKILESYGFINLKEE